MEEKSKSIVKTAGQYIDMLPEHARTVMTQLRQIIKKAAPGAEEVISYQMPAFRYHGMLVYYAAFKNHLSLFPQTKAIEVFKEELKGFETTKGTIHFAYNKPLPVDLISDIIRFRMKENLDRDRARTLSKRKKI